MFNIFEDNQAIDRENDSFSDQWLGESLSEGQLAVDVYQNDKKIIIKSTVAGVNPDDLHISLNNDLLTIKGRRDLDDHIKGTEYLYKECYWGPFSRSLVLPVEVDNGKIEASLENGVLTIILTKVDKAKKIEIKIKE